MADLWALSLTQQDSLAQTYRSYDGSSYEVIYRPNDLKRPYIMVARLDSSYIVRQVAGHIEQTILIMLLMSAFVTSVLMLALGHWLLEPILFLRDMLVKASNDPEDPKFQDRLLIRPMRSAGLLSLRST